MQVAAATRDYTYNNSYIALFVAGPGCVAWLEQGVLLA
jgi:hypothetical protein